MAEDKYCININSGYNISTYTDLVYFPGCIVAGNEQVVFGAELIYSKPRRIFLNYYVKVCFTSQPVHYKVVELDLGLKRGSLKHISLTLQKHFIPSGISLKLTKLLKHMMDKCDPNNAEIHTINTIQHNCLPMQGHLQICKHMHYRVCRSVPKVSI